MPVTKHQPVSISSTYSKEPPGASETINLTNHSHANEHHTQLITVHNPPHHTLPDITYHLLLFTEVNYPIWCAILANKPSTPNNHES